jgi:hypothetical protein
MRQRACEAIVNFDETLLKGNEELVGRQKPDDNTEDRFWKRGADKRLGQKETGWVNWD